MTDTKRAVLGPEDRWRLLQYTNVKVASNSNGSGAMHLQRLETEFTTK
jgi:hypothetical protein